jgi:hypothetical protein
MKHMFKGSARVEWKGEKLLAGIENQVRQTVMKATLDLKQRSSDQAPVDTGDLKGNCSAAFENMILAAPSKGTATEKPGVTLTGRVGYSLPYARRQHEELGYNHPKGGKAKYLEDPANAMAKTYQKAIAEAAGKGIKG